MQRKWWYGYEAIYYSVHQYSFTGGIRNELQYQKIGIMSLLRHSILPTLITPTIITPTFNTSTVTDSLCNSGAFSNPNAVWNCPFKTLSRFSDTAAHYVYLLLESIQEGTIHQWLWKAALYPYTVLCIRRRNACRLKF
jgi:hypothetical protein